MTNRSIIMTLKRFYSTSKHEGFLILLFLLTIPLINPYIRGDGNGYYAYVRSAIIDRDLQFENEYRHGDPAFIQSTFDAEGRLWPNLVTDKGYARNQWAIGPSVLWIPFFLIAHGIVWLFNSLGSNIPADGYSLPYRWLCAFGTTLYSFIGLWLAYRMANLWVSSTAALLGAIGIWFASSLLVYSLVLPFQAHALAAFAVALYLWLWYWLRLHRQQERLWSPWAFWGLTAGLMVEVYYLNAVFLLIALMEWVRMFRGKGFREWGKTLVCGSAFSLAGLVALLPHWLSRWILYGSPLETGYRDRFFWDSPRLWSLGFDAEHGMFLWTPILLAAVLGLLLLWRRERQLATGLLLTFAAFYYTVAAYQNWHGQSAFGSRFFVSFTPAFVLGLATFLNFLAEIRKILSYRFFSALLGLLILWNLGFIFQWGVNLVPNRGPVNFAVMASNQVNVVPRRMASFVIRYLTARNQVVREVEAQDIEELKKYQVQR